MMKMNRVVLSVSFALMATSALARPFDGRQDAMGGAGVTSANYLSGSLYNPALVARFGSDDDVGVLLPTVGVEAHDKSGLVDKMDSLNASYKEMDAIYNEITQSGVTADNLARLTKANQTATDTLYSLNNGAGVVEVGANMVIAIPSSTISLAFVTSAYADVQVFTKVDQSDFTTYTDPISGTVFTGIPVNMDNMKSKAIGYGAAVGEIGVSIAKEFNGPFGKQWFGIMPKFQRITVGNTTSNLASDTATDNLRDYTTDKTAVNLDFGYVTEINKSLVLGFAAKNVIAQTVDAPVFDGVVATYKLNPVVTGSATWKPLDSVTLTADVDLLPTKHFDGLSGVDNYVAANDDTQMAAVGAEYNLAHWFQVRTGYKYDMKSNNGGMFTAGFGISPFDTFHIDLAGAYAGSEDFGATLQTSFTF